jgi:hypothetical protein
LDMAGQALAFYFTEYGATAAAKLNMENMAVIIPAAKIIAIIMPLIFPASVSTRSNHSILTVVGPASISRRPIPRKRSE